MRLDCEVIGVSGNGETLTVLLQGAAKRSAQWRNLERQEIKIAETPRTQKLFHLGRHVAITVKVK